MNPPTTLDPLPGASTGIVVTKRDRVTLITRLFQTIIKPFGPLMLDPPLKKDAGRGSPRLTPSSYARRHCNIEERQVEGIWIYDLDWTDKTSPRTSSGSEPSKETRRRRIYYFSGGGWRSPPSPQHWKFCPELSHRLPETTVSVISYPLAPNNCAPEVFPQLLRLYWRLLAASAEAGETVIMAGDSSGANIVLGLTIEALRQHPDGMKPAAVMVISPPCVVGSQNPENVEVEKKDPLLNIKMSNDYSRSWSGEWDRLDPRVSPIQADVSVLAKSGVKLHGITGGHDILSPDAITFREKCSQAGVIGEWLEWDKQMHCFPLAWVYGFFESKEGLAWIIDVLRRTE